MLRIFTGRNRVLGEALAEAMRAPGGEPRLIVVPRQLTLQTERMLLEALRLKGSFQLQVLGAERLCERIFDAAGLPEGTRVDDRGRVMLVRAALRQARDRLTLYRGAEERRGFPERCAAQLERIRQAGVPPETLRACAAELSGPAQMKLRDLAEILEAYEASLAGRYQDGEAEMRAAILRAPNADFLRESSVWFFGFDMMPSTLHALIAAVGAVCPRTGVFLPLENDADARDFDVFLPLQRGFERLCAAARRAGADVERVRLEDREERAADAQPVEASPLRWQDAGGLAAPCAEGAWDESTAKEASFLRGAEGAADAGALLRGAGEGNQSLAMSEEEGHSSFSNGEPRQAAPSRDAVDADVGLGRRAKGTDRGEPTGGAAGVGASVENGAAGVEADAARRAQRSMPARRPLDIRAILAGEARFSLEEGMIDLAPSARPAADASSGAGSANAPTPGGTVPARTSGWFSDAPEISPAADASSGAGSASAPTPEGAGIAFPAARTALQFATAGADALSCRSAPPEAAAARGSVEIRTPVRHDDLRALERELFAYPAQPTGHAARAVQLTLLRDPREECMFAAALTRRLVMRRGWRWNDVLLLCSDVEGYSARLRAAFAMYGVPVVLSSSRSAARHVTAECLLTALRALEKGFQQEDMFALIRTGMMPIADDEGDRLTNYAVRYGLRGTRFLRPLRRGSEAEIAEMEPVRARLMAPLASLRERLRGAATLQDQLAALFGFLTDIDAHAASRARMDRLAAAGLREAAGEEGQVWNRILGAMDQMHALMGTAKLSLHDLGETLSESLSASIIKALPQSGDAVYVQSTDAPCTRSARAMLFLGVSDRPGGSGDELLTPSQKQALSTFAHAYLGPDDADRSRLRRFYLKSALGMASDYVSVSCPLSGADGSAQRPGAMFAMIKSLFPGTNVRGGVSGDAQVERMLRAAPRAALSFAARGLAGMSEGAPLPQIDAAALAELACLAREAQPVSGEAGIPGEGQAAGRPVVHSAPSGASPRAGAEETANGVQPRAGGDVSPCAGVENMADGGASSDGTALDAASSGESGAARPCAEARKAARPAGTEAAGALWDGGAPAAEEARFGLSQLRSALNRAESADRLAPQTARALYGALQRMSVTRLELFASCPFAYFARYGLQPERVEPFELNARDEGTFFHSAVAEFLMRSREDLNALPAETAASRMDAISDALLDAMSDSGPLGDSAVSRAERRRLKETARMCAVELAQHMEGSAFHAAAFEQSFGPEDGALSIRLPGGCALEGRIDRVDLWDEGGFLRVIDYKRSGRSVDLTAAYCGLRLQLPVYLAAARRKWGARIAGGYYFVLGSGMLATQQTDPKDVERERMKAFRMEGLVPDDIELLAAMSPNFGDVFKVRVTGADRFAANALRATPRQYEGVLRCALRRAAEHVAGIERGACQASPARLGNADPCSYCDFRTACGFDEQLSPGMARKIQPLERGTALALFEEEAGAEGES